MICGIKCRGISFPGSRRVSHCDCGGGVGVPVAEGGCAGGPAASARSRGRLGGLASSNSGGEMNQWSTRWSVWGDLGRRRDELTSPPLLLTADSHRRDTSFHRNNFILLLSRIACAFTFLSWSYVLTAFTQDRGYLIAASHAFQHGAHSPSRHSR